MWRSTYRIVSVLEFIYVILVYTVAYGTTYDPQADQTPVNQKFGKKQNPFSLGNVQICENSLSIPVACDPDYPYRYIDGTCNNLDNPTWCSALEPYQRFLPPYYEGFGDFRQSVKGGPLPLVRKLSLNINIQHSVPAKTTSNMFPIFGQMFVHDISSALQYGEINCCLPEFFDNNLQCLPIFLSPDDPYYSHFNVTCLNFRRTFKFEGCDSDKRQQQNMVTGSIDASTTYGTTEQEAQYLREDGTGKLRSVSIHNEDLLIYNEDPDKSFCLPENPRTCFTTGDTRVNQHAALAGMETLFMREHNRIVTEFKVINPSWDGEKLYQEARKLVGAQMQCIGFKEFLPLLLGKDAIEHFGLSMSKPGRATKYDPNVRCGVWASYAQAVGRVHTQVGGDIGMKNVRFEDIAGNPDLLRHGYMKNILQGSCRAASEKYDRFFVRDMKDHLFIFQTLVYGVDLAAIDMIRGRDHGLPPYVDILNFCNGGELNITTFEDLLPFISWENIRILQENYKDVRDVDQWTGVQMERYVPGVELGPTAVCILGRQFRVLKYGDRFFFEHEGEVPSFTHDQRESLKRHCSLSRILCDNNKQKEQQRHALLLPSFRNPILPCVWIPRIDLNLWKDDSGR